MITKELQQLSDKLVGSHTSAHEISKQVDYIEKNYEGGGSGGGSESPLIITGTYEETDFVIRDSSYAEIKEAFMAGRTVLIAGRNQVEYSMVIGVIHDNINNEYHVTTITYNYSTREPFVHDFIGYDEDGYLVG